MFGGPRSCSRSKVSPITIEKDNQLAALRFVLGIEFSRFVEQGVNDAVFNVFNIFTSCAGVCLCVGVDGDL